LTNGGPLLPAWPVRAACEALADPGLATGDPWRLLAAFEAAGSVFNNATQNIACYDVPADYWLDGQWDYQWCTETIPEESYFTCDGVRDMFEPRAFDWDAVSQHCFAAWGVRPRFEWMRANYGNVFDWATGGVTNIVFSNGLYDPWSSAGVKANLSDALPAVIIPTGAHHIDTFFSNDLDPAAVTAARAFEVAKIREWIAEFYAARAAAEL
jgi:lysosomal Pro-X carboxypeptidase